MGSRLTAAALVTAALIATSGCGGKTLDSYAVASCLRGQDFTVRHLGVSPADGEYVAHDLLYARSRKSRASVAFGDVGKLEGTYFASGRTDSRADALVVWDRYEPASGKRLIACLK